MLRINFVWPSLVLALACNCSADNDRPPLVLNHVHVIDVISGELQQDIAILIEDDRITAVEASANLEIPEEAAEVDCTGQYAIPGLWDMHIHWYGQESMKLFPINGVTGVRVMWGSFMHHAWRRAFESGAALGPRMLIGSAIIDGPEPVWPGSIVASDDASGRKAIELAIQGNADFAKVYSLLPREAYFAIAEESRVGNLPFDGHVPMMVSAREASEAGHRCMEHLYELLLACSSEEPALREMQSRLVSTEGKVAALRNSAVQQDVHRRALATYDPQKAAELFALFRANNTWQCPTLTVLRNLAYMDEPEVRNHPALHYIPKAMLAYLAPEKDRFGDDDEARQFTRAALAKKYEMLQAMHKSGVRVLAGTDVLNPYCFPGFSLHGELQLMVEKAGFTPMDALRTATINPAIFQGKQASLGSIEPGKVADLVLLRANPLENIRHTTEIEAVFLRGRHYSRKQLDGMLDECAKQTAPAK